MDAKYTMILVDGKRVASRETRPNSDNAGIEQGWLPPLPAIERIEVVPWPNVFFIWFRCNGWGYQYYYP